METNKIIAHWVISHTYFERGIVVEETFMVKPCFESASNYMTDKAKEIKEAYWGLDTTIDEKRESFSIFDKESADGIILKLIPIEAQDW
jgi:hypothetical protein